MCLEFLERSRKYLSGTSYSPHSSTVSLTQQMEVHVEWQTEGREGRVLGPVLPAPVDGENAITQIKGVDGMFLVIRVYFVTPSHSTH